jgi:uncharacterized protein (TIGR00255 family)
MVQWDAGSVDGALTRARSSRRPRPDAVLGAARTVYTKQNMASLDSIASLYSMTGYATQRVEPAPGEAETPAFTLTLKSVNHRFLDLQLRLALQSDPLDLQLRKLLKDNLRRGHVELTLQLDRRAAAPSTTLTFNDDLLASYLTAFRLAAIRHQLTAEPDLNELLRTPGMLTTQQSTAPEETVAIEAAVLAALPALLAQFNDSRAQEGAALADSLRANMHRLLTLAAEASTLREGVREVTFDRLRVRIAELVEPAPSGELESRLLTEAALLADRSDIEEELVRLRTHAGRFLALLAEGGELGKRLDFLLQELNREANTLLSKTSGAASGSGLRLTDIGLEMKVEIERAKEQIQNLE